MRDGKHALSAVLAAGLLAAASVVPAIGQEIHENSGQLCFETTPDGATMVGHRLDGCFNAGCTDIPENSLIATVTQVRAVVRVQVRVVTVPSGAIICNADCNFMPQTHFELGMVPAEIHQVYLGDRAIGAWVPVPGGEPCLCAA